MITAIRAALQTLLAGVDGINGANAYPPETVSMGIYAWCGFDDEAIEMGPAEIGLHILPIYAVVNRNAALPSEVAATEPVIERIKTAIRGAQSLGLAGVDRTEFVRVQQSIVQVGNESYVGFVMTLRIKTRENVAAQYGG